MLSELSQTAARLIEEASDETARLDTVCALAPVAAALALRCAVAASLAQATPRAFALLVAARGDPAHERALPAEVSRWDALAEREDRRASGGALLSAAQVVAMTTSTASPSAAPEAALRVREEELDHALRPGGIPRSVWVRALSAAGAIDDAPTGDLVAALVLCAAGTTERLRFLPFADVEPDMRAAAMTSWRAGEPEPWMHPALGAAARSARALRLAVTRMVHGLSEEDARLEPLGRAAITARRALFLLRSEFALTVPTLAARLESSRPAAGDALERLAQIGLSTEVTGRGRDRVYALTAALALVASPQELAIQSA